MRCKSCDQERSETDSGICIVCENIDRGKVEVKNEVNTNIHLATTVDSKIGKANKENTYLQ